MTETPQDLLARLTGFAEGPWILGGCSGRMITTPDGYVGDGFIADVDTKANAALIAAAPDLHRELTAALTREAAALAREAKLVEALKTQSEWVAAALSCEAWDWDADQKACAETDLLIARAALGEQP